MTARTCQLYQNKLLTVSIAGSDGINFTVYKPRRFKFHTDSRKLPQAINYYGIWMERVDEFQLEFNPTAIHRSSSSSITKKRNIILRIPSLNAFYTKELILNSHYAIVITSEDSFILKIRKNPVQKARFKQLRTKEGIR